MSSVIYSDFTPGEYVINKNDIEWGVGQIQSSIGNVITANFENVGKKVMNSKEIKLEIIKL
jgi:hypothetical protein